jgi:hypothetical protein
MFTKFDVNASYCCPALRFRGTAALIFASASFLDCKFEAANLQLYSLVVLFGFASGMGKQ